MDFTGIFQDQDGSYFYRIKKVLSSGEKIDTKKKGFQTKKEAKAARERRLVELGELRDKATNKRIRFDALYDEFLKNEAQGNRKYSTLRRYESLHRNYLSPAFGQQWADSITSGIIGKFLRDLKMKQKSIGYIESFSRQLNLLFQYAVANHYVRENPMRNVQLPRVEISLIYEREELQKVISEANIQRLTDRLKNSSNMTPFLLGYYMGLRVGEAYALRWCDIDFTTKTLRIERQLQCQNLEWCLVSPKTRKSYRRIQIPDILLYHLQGKKKEQEEQRKRMGAAYFDNPVRLRLKPFQDELTEISDFICVKTNGKMLTTYSARFITIAARELEIPNYRFHHLRHTHASMLANHNISAVLLKERLGHEKVETSWAFYSHVTEEARIELGCTMNRMFSRP